MNFFKKLFSMCNCKNCCRKLFHTKSHNMHNSKSRLLIFLRRYLSCVSCFKSDQTTTEMGSKISKGSSRSNLSTVLSENEINLLINSTKMNRQEITDFHENFLKDCPTGVITKTEFVKMFKQLHSNDGKKQKVEKFSEYVFR